MALSYEFRDYFNEKGQKRLENDIEQLKDPKPYQEKFKDLKVAELQQALDILRRLRMEVDTPAALILSDARDVLVKEMKTYLTSESDKK